MISNLHSSKNAPLAANEGSKQEAIVSFYPDDSDTVFLVFFTI